MQNICLVTEYLKNSAAGESLEVVKTLDGRPYLTALAPTAAPGLLGGKREFFRMYNFIGGGVSIESKPTAEEFELSGEAFGNFQRCMNGFAADKLHETIKDFHNTTVRFQNFLKAAKENKANRADGVRKEINFYLSLNEMCGKITESLTCGEIPLRVTHNDTKLNNVLIDRVRMRVAAVIDLDTVMPGSVLYDFGDSIRTGASTAAEDETDLSKVHFSRKMYEAYKRGFLKGADGCLTDKEMQMFPLGAQLMTLECGMRFLTDYLDGDVYFKIHRPNHNLDRARTQIRLLEEMTAAFN
jgi:hypothetical protein